MFMFYLPKSVRKVLNYLHFEPALAGCQLIEGLLMDVQVDAFGVTLAPFSCEVKQSIGLGNLQLFKSAGNLAN